MTTRRRSSARCSPERHGVGRRSRRRASERDSESGGHGGERPAGQFMLGSSGTAGKAPGTAVPARPAESRARRRCPRPHRCPRLRRWPSPTPLVARPVAGPRWSVAPSPPGRPPVPRRRRPAGPGQRTSVPSGSTTGPSVVAGSSCDGPLVLVGQAVEEGQGRAHGLGHLVGGGQVGKRAPGPRSRSGSATAAGRATPRRSGAPPAGASRAPARSAR